MNNVLIAAALRQLATAFETPDASPPEQPASAPETAAKPRGRGRPPKGGDDTPDVQTTAPATIPAATEPDPFATPTTPAAPTATLEDVRNALTALKNASTQEKALAVLAKAGEANNLGELKPALYGQVVTAVNVELRILDADKKPAAPEPDPFEIPAAAPAKPLTLEDVKAVIVDAQKRTSTDAVQKVLMAHGGKATTPEGATGPSLKALPPENFAAAIAAFKALPATK